MELFKLVNDIIVLFVMVVLMVKNARMTKEIHSLKLQIIKLTIKSRARQSTPRQIVSIKTPGVDSAARTYHRGTDARGARMSNTTNREGKDDSVDQVS